MKNGAQSEINMLLQEANASKIKLPLVLIGFTDSKHRPLYIIADTESTPNLVARSCVINNNLQNKVRKICQTNKAIGEGNGIRSFGLIQKKLFTPIRNQRPQQQQQQRQNKKWSRKFCSESFYNGFKNFIQIIFK